MIFKLRSFARCWRIEILRTLASCRGVESDDLPTRQLIIAPHPDDETFGLGGVIALHSRSAALVSKESETIIVFLTSGGAAHRNCCGISPEELGRLREGAARRATKALGLPEGNLHFLRLKDGSLPHPGEHGFDEAANLLRSIVEVVKPDVVLAPHPFEGWSDHIAAEEMTRYALGRKLGEGGESSLSGVRGIKMCHYCVWFWFSMPLRMGLSVNWQQAVTLNLNCASKTRATTDPDQTLHQAKLAAMKVYLEDICPCGRPSCGVLPRELLRALKWGRELIFRVEG